MNEEQKAMYESLNSLEDAYNLAKANGYTGTPEDYLKLLVEADKAMNKEEMDLDAMEQVAGGGLGDVVDWVKENPGLTAAIGAGVVATGVAVAYGVNYLRNSSSSEMDELLNKPTTGGDWEIMSKPTLLDAVKYFQPKYQPKYYKGK